MSGAIPTRVLSEVLHQKVAGRRVEAGVFTTYSFEPGFFEQEVLPTLFAQSFSHAPRVRLVQLEEALREVGPIAVYFDRKGLKAGTESASLDVQRIPITRRRGLFHAKFVLVLLAPEHDTDGELIRPRTLVTGVLSANLTQAGWWESVEGAWFDDVTSGTKCSFVVDLEKMLAALKKEDRTGAEHLAVDRVLSFLSDEVHETSGRTQRGVLRPRVYSARKSLPEVLTDTLRLREGTYNLEIISPFFEKDPDAGSIVRLIDALQPKATRIYEPRGDDGAAECEAPFYEAVAALPRVRWAKLASSIRRRGKGAEDKETPRYVHAKVYRLWSQSERQEFIVVGSPNMTSLGHAGARRGNFEAAAVIQVPYRGKLGWWLEPVDAPATVFRASSEADEGSGDAPPPLSIRFDWEHAEAAYFWESKKASPFVLGSDGETLADVAEPTAGEWSALPAAVGERLREKLRSTSVLDIAVAGEAAGSLLVTEVGMAHKPSILLSLTPEEILRYWSLLSAEQREAFLEKKAYEELVAAGLAPPRGAALGSETNSMFDRFAGVFHAFERLEGHVRRAFAEDRENEVVYRLFGEKYDSLPRLLDKVIAPEPTTEGDATERDPLLGYVTVLTAESLLRRLAATGEHAEFFAEHGEARRRLQERFENGRALSRSLNIGEDAQAFVRWFERWFMQPAQRVTEA